MKYLFLVVQLMFCTAGFSQEWAEIGATWHYNHLPENYSVFTIDGEQMVGGQMCRHINRSEDFTIWKSDQYEYTYSSNDSVYYWDPDSLVFRMLYDFGANPGDTWIYTFKGQDWQHTGDRDSIITFVDSIDFVTINSHSLRRLFVHYDTSNFEDPGFNPILNGMQNSQIIEFIGDINFMFNTFTLDELIFDEPIPYGLRCYQDTTIGFYDSGIVDSCDWWTDLSVPAVDEQLLMIYPNPVDNYLFVEPKFHSDYATYAIYNLYGHKVLEGVFDVFPIILEMEMLSRGVYIIEFYSESVNASKKFIKI